MPIWMFHPSGVYSVKSFYGVVNNGGIVPIHTPAVWKLVVTRRIHVFLWLVTTNKILTRDNLSKHCHVEDMRCLLCSEHESVDHLFFKCFVAQVIWGRISDIFGICIGSNLLSVVRWWISNDENAVLNTFNSAVIWSLWTLRNEFCFQGKTWSRLDAVLLRVIINVRRWRLLCKDAHTSLLDRNLLLLEKTRSELLRIAWR
jgi:hypothetical protein